MVKKVLRVAFAFVGVIVGAGFATGQEVMQYFVAFGAAGILGRGALGGNHEPFGNDYFAAGQLLSRRRTR